MVVLLHQVWETLNHMAGFSKQIYIDLDIEVNKNNIENTDVISKKCVYFFFKTKPLQIFSYLCICFPCNLQLTLT